MHNDRAVYLTFWPPSCTYGSSCCCCRWDHITLVLLIQSVTTPTNPTVLLTVSECHITHVVSSTNILQARVSLLRSGEAPWQRVHVAEGRAGLWSMTLVLLFSSCKLSMEARKVDSLRTCLRLWQQSLVTFYSISRDCVLIAHHYTVNLSYALYHYAHCHYSYLLIIYNNNNNNTIYWLWQLKAGLKH